jgi:hypothetical protein
MGIPELDKAPWQWCRHCDIGIGCTIYEDRPADCRNFYCRYLLDGSMGEHWKPAVSKMLLTYDSASKHLAIRVDPARVHAWRKEPYLSEIKSWATALRRESGQVIVWQGNVAIAILPQGEKNLGPVGHDQVVVTQKRRGPNGLEFDARVVDKS